MSLEVELGENGLDPPFSAFMVFSH